MRARLGPLASRGVVALDWARIGDTGGITGSFTASSLSQCRATVWIPSVELASGLPLTHASVIRTQVGEPTAVRKLPEVPPVRRAPPQMMTSCGRRAENLTVQGKFAVLEHGRLVVPPRPWPASEDGSGSEVAGSEELLQRDRRGGLSGCVLDFTGMTFGNGPGRKERFDHGGGPLIDQSLVPTPCRCIENSPIHEEYIVLVQLGSLSRITGPRPIRDARVQCLSEKREISQPVDVFSAFAHRGGTINRPVRLPLLGHDVLDVVPTPGYAAARHRRRTGETPEVVLGGFQKDPQPPALEPSISGFRRENTPDLFVAGLVGARGIET